MFLGLGRAVSKCLVIDDDELASAPMRLALYRRTGKLTNRQKLLKRLPAFRANMNAMPIPKALKDSRFNIRAYHPDLIAALADISSERVNSKN
jgi:hypothetical protein